MIIGKGPANKLDKNRRMALIRRRKMRGEAYREARWWWDWGVMWNEIAMAVIFKGG